MVHNMKQMKKLAEYYVVLLVKLGIYKFSLLLAIALIALAVIVQVSVTLVFQGNVDNVVILRSILFALLITPWAVYFMSVVVEQLEDSCQRLSESVLKLKEMQARDQLLNQELQINIEQLNQQIQERERAELSLEKASREKTTFISTISHELRTPLNGIVGLSHMLLDTKIDDVQRQHLQTIYVSAISLGHIFNDIIEFDKLDRRNLTLHPTTMNFEDFVSEIESVSGLMAEQKGLRFDLDRLTPLPLMIEVDGTRLRQVLWNLLSNAMKFTLEGSIVMSVAAEISQQMAHITIEIEDSGIGISEEELDKIFGLYYQVKSGKNNLHAVGTGIGLAVSQQIIQKMGGEIYVQSEEGFGSTFSVDINVPLTKQTESVATAVPIQKLNIFMLEDIELNVTVACSLLESFGHSVTVARTGQQAIELFQPEKYDVVLLDIQLPDMSGFDVARYFRKHYRDLPPLIALTANTLLDKQKYFSGGMDDAMSKPLSVQSILDMLPTMINRRQNDDVESNRQREGEPSYSNVENMDETVFDYDMLNSYIEILGEKSVLDNVVLFEQVMPSYLHDLDIAMAKQNKEDVANEAHKIKGAASSIGLRRIQEIAQKAQSSEREDWSQNIISWVKQLKEQYVLDIEKLKQWLQLLESDKEKH